MSTRTYKDAIENLNSLQSNFAALEALRQSNHMVQYSKHEFLEYLWRIGYNAEDLNRLNVIHVTGTKGKGSTCAFVDAMLRAVAPERKVGLFTSPHLVSVCERIRINGVPIDEENFVKYFFEVWDRLESNDNRLYDHTPVKPMYFKFLNLVAYHAFLSMKVDATILEVGVGGEYDSTNAVPKPIATGVTSLGLDHTAILGKTLPEIAWQKSGIYKPGVPAFSVQQPQDALEVLRSRAEEKQASSFTVVSVDSRLKDAELGLAGSHQVLNASLAIQLIHSYLLARPVEANPVPPVLEQLPEAFLKGLKNARWPARCQSVTDPKDNKSVWFLDGAHTVESLACCGEWYAVPGQGIKSDVKRILLFNCTNGRSGKNLLGALQSSINGGLVAHRSSEDVAQFFDHVIFCPNVTYADGTFKQELTSKGIDGTDLAQLRTQQDLASAWKALNPSFDPERIHVVPSIQHAVIIIQGVRSEFTQPTDVLVTGSLLLIGGLMEVAGLTEIALNI